MTALAVSTPAVDATGSAVPAADATASGTIATAAADLDHRLFGAKTGGSRRFADARRQKIVIDMRRAAARIANEENTVVKTIGVGIGKIGIGTFDAHRDIVGDEQIEDAINAIGGNAPALRGTDRLGHVIGAGRLVEPGKGREDRRAHRGPLLAGSDQRPFGSGIERRTRPVAMVMIMCRCHTGHIGACRPTCKAGQARLARRFQ